MCETQPKWSYVKPNSSWRIREHVAFVTLKCLHGTLHEVNGCSTSIEQTASARSWVEDRPDLESLSLSLRPSWKCLCHICSMARTGAASSYTFFSSMRMDFDFNLFAVRKRMTAHYCINCLNLQTSVRKNDIELPADVNEYQTSDMSGKKAQPGDHLSLLINLPGLYEMPRYTSDCQLFDSFISRLNTIF
jgi:hypothetical protein